MELIIYKRLSAYFREWGFLFAGISLFVTSLPLYKSGDSPIIWQRWSYIYSSVLACAVIIWFGFFIVTWRASSRESSHTHTIPAWRIILGVAVFLWGLAYLLSALDTNVNAGRILDLNFFGSTLPTAALLELIAIICLVLSTILFISPRLPIQWQNLGLILITLSLLAVLGEGVARIKAIAFPETQGFPTYSSAIWNRRYVKKNSLGYRDVEHNLERKDGAKRVLIIGDSFTFGTGINNVDDRFGEQLVKRLYQRTQTQWEVINAGRPDTHTLQHIESLKQMLVFEPDLVILLYVFNDMDYLSPITSRNQIIFTSSILGKLHPTRLFYLNSYLFQEVFVRIRKAGFITGNNGPNYNAYSDNLLLQRHFEDISYFIKTSHDSRYSRLLIPFDNLIGASAERVTRYQHFLKEAESYGLPVCSLESAFDRHSVESLRVNSLDGHPSAMANRIAADKIVDCLLAG